MPSFSDVISQQFGGDVTGIDTEKGTADISMTLPNGKQQSFTVDYKGMKDALASKIGIDPLKFDISSAEAPVKDSALSFMQQVDFSESKTTNDKANYLASRFGKENIKYNKQTGGFSVKGQDGVWRQGDMSQGLKGAAANLVGSAGMSSLGMAVGAEIGAGAGSVFSPLGTAVGAALGAGIGGVVGKLTNIGSAHALGIRTDVDLEEISMELGKEFLYGLAGEGIMRGGMAAAKATPAAMNKVVNKIKGSLPDTPASKAFITDTMEMTTGVPSSNWRFMMDNPEVTTGLQKEVVQWLDKGAEGLNPMHNRMIDHIENAVNKVETAKNFAYSEMNKALTSSGKVINIDAAALKGQFDQMLFSKGLVDDAGTWLSSGERGLSEILNTADINKIKQIHTQLQRATELGKGVLPSSAVGRLSAEETLKLVRGMDDILDVNIMNAMGGQSRQLISQMRSNVLNSVTDALGNASKAAQESFLKNRKAVSDALSFFDGLGVRKGSDFSKLDSLQMAQKILKPTSGLDLRAAFEGALSATGQSTKDFWNPLKAAETAILTSNMYRPGTTSSGFSALVQGLTSAAGVNMTSPRSMSKVATYLGRKQAIANSTSPAAVEATMPILKPVNVLRKSGKVAEKAIPQASSMSANPESLLTAPTPQNFVPRTLTSQDIIRLATLGKTAQLVNSMDDKMLQQLMINPEGQTAILSNLMKYASSQSTAVKLQRDELINQGLGAISGAQQDFRSRILQGHEAVVNPAGRKGK